MSTHNICFTGEMRKIISKLSPNTHLICSTVTSWDVLGWAQAHSLGVSLSVQLEPLDLADTTLSSP